MITIRKVLVSMRIKQNILKAFVVGSVVSVVFCLPTFAISENAGGVTNQNQSNGSSDSAGAGRLTDAKQRICEQNENRIHNLFANMNQLANRQMNLLNQVTERVRTYYTDNNLTVENYDQLSQLVDEARVTAQTAVQASVQTSSQFGCDTDDPKGTVNQYKVQVRTQIQELKDYRIAVKNLVAAVKTAVQTTQEEQ